MSAASLARLRRVPLEAVVWTCGIVALAFLDPHAPDAATLCPFHHIGVWLGAALGSGPVEFCPGCGLGRSIAALWRGDVALSWSLHPLGLPAVGVLAAHVARLARTAWAGAPGAATHPA